ncbi:hypothetical protein E0485_19370 [Paenibacillus albiflavus]|uniref:Uncharacterized protein n=1 Tax=Paenibacillus albiflavus TaxID=2545760 RepID=A0A4R4E9Y9_9BACL|nr:hypothetical protein [Paenibacillus albiflavus]TCZ74625.1 hypothetical protein E0485_19370 [Paenibacillus albiflavus]
MQTKTAYPQPIEVLREKKTTSLFLAACFFALSLLESYVGTNLALHQQQDVATYLIIGMAVLLFLGVFFFIKAMVTHATITSLNQSK